VQTFWVTLDLRRSKVATLGLLLKTAHGLIFLAISLPQIAQMVIIHDMAINIFQVFMVCVLV
jgi:hypothetical protein